MGASIAKIVLTKGAPAALHCPCCGAVVFKEDEYGGEDMFCHHVLAVYDWADVLSPGPNIDEDLAGELEALEDDVDGSHSEVAKALAELLDTSDLALHIRERARGGGHDGTDFVAAFRFPVEGEFEDD